MAHGPSGDSTHPPSNNAYLGTLLTLSAAATHRHRHRHRHTLALMTEAHTLLLPSLPLTGLPA